MPTSAVAVAVATKGEVLAAAPAPLEPEAARWSAAQATLVVMPVFVLALSNPALYLAAILKAVPARQSEYAAG